MRQNQPHVFMPRCRITKGKNNNQWNRRKNHRNRKI
jgi:hypothetical protein